MAAASETEWVPNHGTEYSTAEAAPAPVAEEELRRRLNLLQTPRSTQSLRSVICSSHPQCPEQSPAPRPGRPLPGETFWICHLFRVSASTGSSGMSIRVTHVTPNSFGTGLLHMTKFTTSEADFNCHHGNGQCEVVTLVAILHQHLESHQILGVLTQPNQQVRHTSPGRYTSFD
ncbi:uncharacterized protein LOC144247296 [Lonchura striata]